MISKLNDRDYARFYGYSIRYRNDAFLFMHQIRKKGWDRKNDNETLESYQQLLKHPEWILFELIYKINQSRLIVTPLNAGDDRKMKLFYIEFLLSILLTIMLKMRALSMHKIHLLLETKKIYADLLKTMKLSEQDFLLQIDKCWLEDYFVKYDKNFELRFNIQELHRFFEMTKQRPKPIREYNGKKHELPQFLFIDSVCNSTPIFYTNDDDFQFEDEDDLALKNTEAFNNDLHRITLSTSPFPKSIHNLFINDKTICDCGRNDCNGCYPTCLKCGEKKCFAICRYNVNYSYYDVFHQAQTINKYDPLYKSKDSMNNNNVNQQQQQQQQHRQQEDMMETDDDNSVETPVEQLSQSDSIDDELTILSTVPYGPHNHDNFSSEFPSQSLTGDEVESFFTCSPPTESNKNFHENNNGETNSI
ncbi:uncharacterized protein LOC124496234 [Dermatophagoides farinae]|uniref:uncharacterized protein LOC124496234 n=1 Tax=Dermatophagoides farinae TaxID=6954 RepID=UPI003F605E30